MCEFFLFLCKMLATVGITEYMEEVLAYDIDACSVCGGLYFPGDDLIVTAEGLAHDYCVRSDLPLALSDK